MNARRRAAQLAGALAITMLLTTPAIAAGNGGGGGGGGGGSGGGSGSGSGSGSGDTDTGSLYADLNIVLRAANGSPILKKYVVPATETEAQSVEYCAQPVAYQSIAGLTSAPNPVDGRQVWVVPLQGEWLTNPPVPLPVAEIGPCDPQPQYAMFVKEVDLERLNQARMADDVIARKTADVETKLRYADAIALEATGRISYDGTPIDASPENSAIYRSLMLTGTVAGLPADLAGPPAAIGPVPGDEMSNSRFDAMELAATAIGAAGSKATPINIDSIEYYNRIIGFPAPADPTATPPVPEYVSPWGVQFVRSANPDNPAEALAGSEQLVDYSHFTYNRSETFKGSVTWLDVPTLTWKVSHIVDVVPFTNLSSYTEIGTHTLTGITAFAQLADDVRSLCNFIPDNTFIPGFAMDVPGVDTYAQQLAAIHDPAVDLGVLPHDVFKSFLFQVTASLLNPWAGDQIAAARLRLTIEAPDALAADDVTAIAADGQAVPFTSDANGDLVGWWGPDTGFPVKPGYNVATTFDVQIADAAPSGPYNLTLDLVGVDDPSTVLAQDIGTVLAHDNVATVLWAGSLVKYATQGAAVTIPVTVHSPGDATGSLRLTVSAPESLTSGEVNVYGDNGVTMAPMSLSVDTQGRLTGTWSMTLTTGYTPVNWYATVAEGAPVGSYTFGVSLVSGNTVDPATVVISAPESHGQQPPGAGEDTTAPVVTITSASTLGATASFALTADEDGVTFECQLTTDGSAGLWEPCGASKTYSALSPGTYFLSARGTDQAGNRSTSYRSETWSVVATGGGATGTASSPLTYVRLGGTDRFGTAVLTSQAAFPAAGSAKAVVLASGDGYADALVGVPLAQAKSAPLLLVSGGSLGAATQAEIQRVLPVGGVVYVLGGTSAVPASVDTALTRLGYVPTRYAGADRFDTAIAVAGALGNPGTVLLATGTNFPDALSAGPAAASIGGVVLLTDGVRMPAAVRAYLSAHNGNVYAVGGWAVIAAPTATPLAGADRYATATAVASGLFHAPTSIGIASGTAFPDALSGGAFEAHFGGALVLSAPKSLPAASATYLDGNKSSVTTWHMFGGVNALSDAVQVAVIDTLS